MSRRTPQLLRAAERGPEGSFQHPLNERSELHGFELSRRTGLTRTAVNWVRVPPGKESYAYHAHQAEEEWIYVLSGRGVAEIDDAEHEVGAGDFLGFPTPSVGHHMRNDSEEDLVYLCGGEILALEVADFPKLGLRMIRQPDRVEVVEVDELRPVSRNG